MKLISLLRITFFSFFIIQYSFAQSFTSLSRPEKWWVITHPFVACKAKKLTQIARNESRKLEGDTILDRDPDGGQVDAFRHSYWMALLSQNFCWKKAIKLGMAHEKGNYLQFKNGIKEDKNLPDSIAGAMDLFNNYIGVAIGCNNKLSSEEEIKKIVLNEIVSGKMRIIKKDNNKNPLDCNDKIINLASYDHIWNIPKCLVRSDNK